MLPMFLLRNVTPNGAAFTAANNQRYGIQVSYTEGKFIVASGSTGDSSSMAIKLATSRSHGARAYSVWTLPRPLGRRPQRRRLIICQLFVVSRQRQPL